MSVDALSGLFPVPRTVRILDASAVPLDTEVLERTAPQLPPQGYRLVLRDGILLEYADPDGRRYGLDTLRQLGLAHPSGFPALEIEDHPAFLTRGFMLDISRNRVPRRSTLEQMLRVLASARYNQLQLYMEHTFEYEEHEPVWREASPLTGADIRWLDALCHEHGIELVPNQNVFGHMEHWLSAGPDYLARAELPGGFEQNGVVHPPTTLAARAENAAFVGKLLDELLLHFTSRSVNIGGDETFELGLGASKDAVEVHGTGRVYLDYLHQVWTPLLEQGREVQFWGDIVHNSPELVTEIPSGVVPIAWWYERPYPDFSATPWDESAFSALFSTWEGIELISDGFGERSRSFAEAGVPYWVAPGTGAWASLLGRTTNAFPNLYDAAQYSGPLCAGYLVTHWGDRGAWEHPSVVVPPLAYGGAASWNPDVDPAGSVWAHLSSAVFEEDEGRIARALDLMGGLWETLGVPVFNCSPLFFALVDARADGWPSTPDASRIQAALGVLEECESLLRDARPGCVDGEFVLRELLSAVALARFGLEHIQDPGADAGARGPRVRDLLLEHAACWLARAQPGGLDLSLRNAAAMCSLYSVDTDDIAAEARKAAQPSLDE